MRSENSTLFGGLSATLLWENPNPNVAFGRQSINIKDSITNYDYVCFVMKKSVTENTVGNVLVEVKAFTIKTFNDGEQRFIPIGTFNSENCVREFRFLTNENRVIVENQDRYSHGQTINTQDIPFAIYGIKGSIQGIK